MKGGASQPPLGAGGPIGANPSFVELIRGTEPQMAPPAKVGSSELGAAHGTTVLALKFGDGVVMAGDRRATAGNEIADDKMDKVFAADEYSAISISGAAGQAVELVKLFQLELEHYEKITGDRLSLEGKANRLAQMIRGNLPMAMQGLIVVPLFGGFDERRREGRLFRYDATGGRWEDEDFDSTGSGARAAKGTLKKRWQPGLSREVALKVAVEALLDASQEDVATGGPDPSRGIFPTVLLINEGGVETLEDDEVRSAYESVVGERS